jgi:hypothetical protein
MESDVREHIHARHNIDLRDRGKCHTESRHTGLALRENNNGRLTLPKLYSTAV